MLTTRCSILLYTLPFVLKPTLYNFQDKVNEQLSKQVDLDSDDSGEEHLNQSEEKERHSSGESHDSAISITPPSFTESQSPTSKRFLVIPAKLSSNNSNLRGILKRNR